MVKLSACHCRRHERHMFDPWSRKWHPTPVFLPGKFYGQRSLTGFVVHGAAKSWTGLSADIHSFRVTVG